VRGGRGQVSQLSFCLPVAVLGLENRNNVFCLSKLKLIHFAKMATCARVRELYSSGFQPLFSLYHQVTNFYVGVPPAKVK